MESKKAISRCGNYQDAVTSPLSHASDNVAAAQDNEDEQDKLSLEVDATSNTLSAVEKVCTSISSSPSLDNNVVSQL